MSGYILNREGLKEDTKKKFYRQSELELMTTHQFREICRKEKIVQGILNPLDKEELTRVIMRYRGTREQLLIREENESNYFVPRVDEEGNILYDRSFKSGSEHYLGMTDIGDVEDPVFSESIKTVAAHSDYPANNMYDTRPGSTEI